MPYLRQISFTGIPASASFKIATIWLSVMRLLIVKLLCFSLKEILRASCIILRGSYRSLLGPRWNRNAVFLCAKTTLAAIFNSGFCKNSEKASTRYVASITLAGSQRVLPKELLRSMCATSSRTFDQAIVNFLNTHNDNSETTATGIDNVK